MFIKIYDEIPEEAKTIREAVFIKEQGFKDEFDEIDDVAKHVLLFEGDIPVGTCRFFFSEERNCYVIGRIAVRKEFRGKRYGEKMLQGAEDCGKLPSNASIMASGFKILSLNAFWMRLKTSSYNISCAESWTRTRTACVFTIWATTTRQKLNTLVSKKGMSQKASS